MIDSFSNDTASQRRMRLAACLLVLGLALGGCKTGMPGMADSFGKPAAPVALPRDQASLHRFSEDWGRRYDANRADKNTALTYARSLHALGQNTQAVAVLQGLAIQNPEDMQVLSAYGKALADAGQLKQAADILTRAHSRSGRTGRCFRRRAPSPISWAIMTPRAAITTRR